MKRNQAMRHALAMKEYLVNSGYKPEFIEEYLNDKAETQKTNMRRGVIGLFYNRSQFDVYPKAFATWKQFVLERKLVKEKVRYVLNSIHHPLHKAFQRWKYDMHDAQRKLFDLSKQQLVEKIIADENMIGATESRLQRMDNAIDLLAIQRQNLLGHFIRGQKLAAALMRSNR